VIETILVALGGNALIKPGETGTIEEQFRNLRVPIGQIARLSRNYRIIITHGNGPQVGNLLLQQECCNAAPSLPLEILVAQTQGEIGYMIESTLDSELMDLGINTGKRLVSLISYVVVDENDPAFQNPSKPIGPSYTEERASKLPYPTKKTAKGYRRVVASPRPVTIVEKREIKELIEMDFIVICCGVDAVIDKGLASAVLAAEVGVDIFLIATDVPGVALDFGKEGETFLPTLKVSDAERYLGDGQFPPGSMGPKVEAAVRFIAGGGKRAVITSIEAIEEAVSGESGTEITG
jgi:carbamate kinase